MNLKEHENRSDMKCWLSENDVEDLIKTADGTERQIAFALAARCGLRSHEVLDVAPDDVVSTDAGQMLKIEHGKGDKYRETPIPSQLATRIETVDDVRSEASSSSILSVTSTQALRKWIKRTRAKCADKTGDDRWKHVSMHDLRRTWATNLGSQDVDPLIVIDWGGWSDLETFLEHYRGTYSPEAQRRERGKVDWL